MPGRRWTADEWADFQAELEQLARTDPAVGKAVDQLDQTVWEITHRPPARRFLRRLGGHSEQGVKDSS